MPERQELTIREQLEAREIQYLSQYAKLSRDSAGRKREERQCDLRPVFQRDRDRILHCKSFRRLKQKTQVFLLPKGGSLPDKTYTYTGGISKCEDHCEGVALK